MPRSNCTAARWRKCTGWRYSWRPRIFRNAAIAMMSPAMPLKIAPATTAPDVPPMLVMITFVGTLIFIFSVGYMAHDGNFTRFFTFLALFAAALTAWFALDLGQYLTLDALKATIPMGRLGTADECVGAFLYLASDELSGYVTGQILEVELPMRRIPTAWITQEMERVPDIDAYVEALSERITRPAACSTLLTPG